MIESTKRIRLPPYNPDKTRRLNDLRIQYMKTKEAAKAVAQADPQKASELTQQANEIFLQIIEEGSKVYR